MTRPELCNNAAHKHKTSKKRRDWRKLHIGVDAEGFIVAAELTASSRDDASTLPDLLAQLEVPIRRFTADGAYDHRSVYDRASAAGTENVVIVIPPRRSALSAGPTDGPWAQCEASLQRIRKVGRREWQKESGYRQQARVENSFFRYKSVFGGDLKARHSELYRVARPPARDPKRFRVFVVVSRQALIDSRFSTIICAPVYSTRHGLATQVDVGLNEGVR